MGLPCKSLILALQGTSFTSPAASISLPVYTAMMPGALLAAVVSNERILACACGERRKQPKAWSSKFVRINALTRHQTHIFHAPNRLAHSKFFHCFLTDHRQFRMFRKRIIHGGSLKANYIRFISVSINRFRNTFRRLG